MKCPFRINTTVTQGNPTIETKQIFAECYENNCPYYKYVPADTPCSRVRNERANINNIKI